MANISFRTTSKLIENLEDPEKSLKSGALFGVAYIRRQWNVGKGADGEKMPNLSKGYKEWKNKKYGRGVRDLTLSGHLTQSLTVVNDKQDAVTITFANAEKPKARGNAEHAENMMATGKGLRRAIVEGIKKSILKG